MGQRCLPVEASIVGGLTTRGVDSCLECLQRTHYVVAHRERAAGDAEVWVLIDRQRDPAEMQNLAAAPADANLQRELDQRLAALIKQHGDDWKFNSSELVEEGGRLYHHSTCYTLDEYRVWARANPDKSK